MTFQLSSTARLSDAAPEAGATDHWSEAESFGFGVNEEFGTVCTCRGIIGELALVRRCYK